MPVAADVRPYDSARDERMVAALTAQARKGMRVTRVLLLFLLLSRCVGPLIPVKNIDEVPFRLKREVVSISIYNKSQLLQKQYCAINIVEGISCNNKV